MPPRDLEELEGALLLPRATAITNSSNSVAASHVAAAVLPVDTFTYNQDNPSVTAILAREEDERRLLSPPEAPSVPQYGNDLQSREKKEQNDIALAQRRGRLAAEAEKEAIQRAGRKVHAINYHTSRKTEEGNALAKIQAKTRGVQMDGDKYSGAVTATKKEQEVSDKPKPAFSTQTGGGYEVATYETSAYDRQTYNVSEYRSIYDQVS